MINTQGTPVGRIGGGHMIALTPFSENNRK